MKTYPVSCRVDEETNQKLEDIARYRSLFKSEVIKAAIEAFLSSIKRVDEYHAKRETNEPPI